MPLKPSSKRPPVSYVTINRDRSPPTTTATEPWESSSEAAYEPTEYATTTTEGEEETTLPPFTTTMTTTTTTTITTTTTATTTTSTETTTTSTTEAEFTEAETLNPSTQAPSFYSYDELYENEQGVEGSGGPANYEDYYYYPNEPPAVPNPAEPDYETTEDYSTDNAMGNFFDSSSTTTTTTTEKRTEGTTKFEAEETEATISTTSTNEDTSRMQTDSLFDNGILDGLNDKVRSRSYMSYYFCSLTVSL